jgi:hypothetical protein
MRIKNPEWLRFKLQFLEILEVLSGESEKFDLPEEADNFELFVNDCEVHPVFTRKDEFLKVEYDFTLCETKLRTLSCSMYRDAARIEVTLKEPIDGNNIIWQESRF